MKNMKKRAISLMLIVLQLVAVLVLPLIWELNGIWLSVVVAEFSAAALSLLFIKLKRKKYDV